MKTSLVLRIVCRDETVARAIATAIGPDNVDFPPGQRLVMAQAGKLLRFAVTSTGSVASLLASVEEILTHAQLAAEALRVAE
jgi:hypothetical protein